MDMRRGVANGVVFSGLFPKRLRWRALRLLGADVGAFSINSGCWVGGMGLCVGEGTFINHRCFFDTSARVTVGARCNFGMQVTVVTSTHELAGVERRAGTPVARPVSIGDGCWIGARAVILPGVTVGPGCVVAAGAVVTADCEPDGIYAGLPARRIRELSPGTKRSRR